MRSNYTWIKELYERFEEDYGIYGFECRKCGQRLESDSSTHDLWKHYRDAHPRPSRDWAEPR